MLHNAETELPAVRPNSTTSDPRNPAELDEDYNRNRILAGQARVRYQRSMELNEAAAASVFKSRFETARATALATKDQIQSILESIR